MMKYLCYTLLLLLNFHSLLGQHSAQVKEIRIQSDILNQEREVLIYTPPAYKERPYQYYHVVYVFDAQAREFLDLASSLLSFMTDASYKFIVVGIKATYIEEPLYARNNDFLPPAEHESSKQEWGGLSRNADNFMTFLQEELIPYVDHNYRTLANRTAIGHSLGASFLVYAMTQNPELFYNYINISPNLAFDQEKLKKDLTQFDFGRLRSNTFFYLSSANEGKTFGKAWKEARIPTHAFLRDTLKSQRVAVMVEEFPEESHWSTVYKSMSSALNSYIKTVYNLQGSVISKEEYEVTFRLKVPGSDDEIYITGNQEALGNWNPGKIKMKKVSAFEREITLKVKSPMEFKFTKGSWDTEAHVIQEQAFGANLMLKPRDGETYKLDICRYKGEDWEACQLD